MKRGVLLFAHGARDPGWARPFEAVARRVRAAGVEAALGYLEFMSPRLLDAGATLAGAGCDHVEVLPLFLGAGGHVRRELPALVDELRRRHPGVCFVLRGAVGEDEAVIEAMAACALRGAGDT
ncbi:sirohydrochlorin chelatase [Piscinibacter sp.]|uniref:sirohydrochlorin chelatase n=1 Tax=Piscinibacter sp. TaxID=1903157 RepID=UPI0039E294CC